MPKFNIPVPSGASILVGGRYLITTVARAVGLRLLSRLIFLSAAINYLAFARYRNVIVAGGSAVLLVEVFRRQLTDLLTREPRGGARPGAAVTAGSPAARFGQIALLRVIDAPPAPEHAEIRMPPMWHRDP
jgi:hypothetical protein